MLTFNHLLSRVGLDPKDVYLVRHQDARMLGKSVYGHYKSSLDRFETYQRLQGKECFSKRGFLASFVAAPPDRTLFIGLYRNHGRVDFPLDLNHCPLSGVPVGAASHFFYHLESDDRLNDFKERLSIDWGPGYRSWIQNADSKDSGDKKIVELLTIAHEPSFPGYREFRSEISDIPKAWPSWQQALRQSKGIYLLSCKECGKQYVGKADGDDGFWGRFFCYATTGHGGNEGMKEHRSPGYFVSILEALGTPTQGELDQLESLWKEKLGTRRWGLNEN